MTKVNIHSSLARFTNNQTQLELPIHKISDILPVLCQYYEKLRNNILDKQGELTPYVNIYVNGKHVNQIAEISISDADTIDVITALVGG